MKNVVVAGRYKKDKNSSLYARYYHHSSVL